MSTRRSRILLLGTIALMSGCDVFPSEESFTLICFSEGLKRLGAIHDIESTGLQKNDKKVITASEYRAFKIKELENDQDQSDDHQKALMSLLLIQQVVYILMLK